MKPFIFIFLIVFSINCNAGNKYNHEKDYTREIVKTMTQERGETGKDFLRRIAQFIDWHTYHTTYEHGGFLCEDDKGKRGIIIYTWKSHFTTPIVSHCPLIRPNITNIFIHSHPPPGHYKLKKQDLEVANKQRVFFKLKPGTKRVVTHENEITFSKIDIENGPGYLIGGGKLFYQNGEDTQVFIMNLRKD